MGQAARALSAIDSAVSEAVARGLCQLRAGDEVLDGRTIEIAGRPSLNFSSCSYLGLELDPRVRGGAIDAIERYGTQFSSSRTYVSAPLYEELESLLDQITGGYALATPRREGGMATPRGLVRLGSAALAGVCCAAAAGLLAQSGSFLGAMSLDFMARSFPGSDLGLEPVARLLGEARPGRWTSTVISAWEGLMFGFGLILGLTHRPR